MAKRRAADIASVMICVPGPLYPVADKRKLMRVRYRDGTERRIWLGEDCPDWRAKLLVSII